jgi:phosphoribosylformylglycinamidine synthase subunit PurS
MSKKAAKKLEETSVDGLRARIRVLPRAEILDPQGKAIADALKRLGFEGVEEVRAGKTYELRLKGVTTDAAAALLEQMAQKLLANDVVEDYAVEVLGDGVP